jgi:hypothetical protein
MVFFIFQFQASDRAPVLFTSTITRGSFRVVFRFRVKREDCDIAYFPIPFSFIDFQSLCRSLSHGAMGMHQLRLSRLDC